MMESSSLKTRVAVALISSVLLIISGIYNYNYMLHYDTPPYVDLDAITYNLSRYEGEKIWFQGFVREKTYESGKIFLTFETSYGSIDAVIPERVDVNPGGLVGLRGELREGVVYGSEVHVIDYRKLRYGLSFIASLVVLYLFRNYQLTREGISDA